MLFVFGVVPAGRDLFQRLAAFDGGGARQSFLAADYDVNMERIALDAVAHARCILGGQRNTLRDPSARVPHEVR
jgi:hypothetical protein